MLENGLQIGDPHMVETFAPLEKDPTGRSANEAGAKLDHGKNRLGLVLEGFPRALWAVGEVGTYGANKYTDNGWIEVPDGVNRYTDAMYRHLLKEAAGERVDGDTQLLHAAHAAWNALARLDLMLRPDSRGKVERAEPKILEGVCCNLCVHQESSECPVESSSPWSMWKNFCSEYQPKPGDPDALSLTEAIRRLNER